MQTIETLPTSTNARELAAFGALAVIISSDTNQTDFEFAAFKGPHELVQARHDIHQRGRIVVGLVSIAGGFPAVALEVELDAQTLQALSEVYVGYFTTRLRAEMTKLGLAVSPMKGGN